jgi:hypothetical protein
LINCIVSSVLLNKLVLSWLDRDSSVGIARPTGRTAGVRFLAGEIRSSLHHSVQTGSEAHPDSYPMGTGVITQGAKRPGREADHSFLSRAEVKNGGALYLLSSTRLYGMVLN